jgi:ApbE superfamily uncharacterized protein (UPF0280 family)
MGTKDVDRHGRQPEAAATTRIEDCEDGAAGTGPRLDGAGRDGRLPPLAAAADSVRETAAQALLRARRRCAILPAVTDRPEALLR